MKRETRFKQDQRELTKANEGQAKANQDQCGPIFSQSEPILGQSGSSTSNQDQPKIRLLVLYVCPGNAKQGQSRAKAGSTRVNQGQPDQGNTITRGLPPHQVLSTEIRPFAR